MNVLFLDDCPDRTKTFRSLVPFATTVETVQEVLDHITKLDEPLDLLLLDHDLGGEIFVNSEDDDCGMEVVRWLCKNEQDIKHVVVHSHNSRAGYEMMQKLRESGYKAIYIPFINLITSNIMERINTERKKKDENEDYSPMFFEQGA